MSPAGRMALWAQMALGVAFARGLMAQPQASSTPLCTEVCTTWVQWCDPKGSRVRCLSERDGLSLKEIHEGDAILPGTPPLRVPQGMNDSMRVALGLPLDVNSASAAVLAQLPGISPRAASAIVEHRRAHGPFATLDDLMAVHGVGKALLGRHHRQLCARRQAPFSSPQPLL